MIRMRAVEVIEATFVPLPGAKFSMCTTLACDRQIPRKCSRGRLDRLADVVHDTLDQRRVVALGHHPDQRLGARFAYHEAALALKLGLSRGDALPYAIGLERLDTAVEAHVLEQLR